MGLQDEKDGYPVDGADREGLEAITDDVCCICLDSITPADLAIIKGCEHMNCGEFIVQGAGAALDQTPCCYCADPCVTASAAYLVMRPNGLNHGRNMQQASCSIILHPSVLT